MSEARRNSNVKKVPAGPQLEKHGTGDAPVLNSDAMSQASRCSLAVMEALVDSEEKGDRGSPSNY